MNSSSGCSTASTWSRRIAERRQVEVAAMRRQMFLIRACAVFLVTGAAVAGCGSSHGDQPQVEQLTPAQAAQKQVLDDQLRIRQQTTQVDR